MCLSACVDNGFIGRGFINPPVIGWLERSTRIRAAPAIEFHQPSRSRVGLKDFESDSHCRVGLSRSFINPHAVGWFARNGVNSQKSN
ncbi:hypothetical protein AVDCRST_MAG92-211 [uncultured Coleofasciculus sp.]|uniref:Uncharacterized protein n=1 Tax=uncultured Coleofasciculus sp. TaxID=1267456 RepID=A0A6J4H3W9_9CYAN|nr:hypothetical protein AVDCRST_MAG92-211 [uncultured Coleofasciculus sp.]